MFSDSKNYYFLKIPNNLNYFEKINWIKEQKELIDFNHLFFQNEQFISWVEVEENEKFWKPYEKLKFFKYYFKIKEQNFLIIEKNNFSFNFYVVINDFLVSFSENYNQSIEIFKNNKIDFVSFCINVGKDFSCNVNYNFKNENYNEGFVFEESLNYNQTDLDSDFLIWFNQNNKNYKYKYFYLFLLILFLFIINFFNYYFLIIIDELKSILDNILK